ncbi:type IV pilus assembly protein PilZ [Colwellia chukchiensis]|uniref:Type IV pilus assembly protein PilZ n=1 Tax=Colwellia chukchiensis TaxID=641665 RepID=A0A1H7M731_9GAMM|nr:PilZ domain-containing protein [Colwellia chukchiensis]SEL06993.1 type IV pilus assembly protein PilZ [Colwellia chukchiensis]
METINLEFISDRDLYQSYMPFMKNGGLFIRTAEHFELGTDIKLIVTLPDSLEASEIVGVVSWITPIGAQNGTPAGIGVSFIEDPDNIRNQIDKSIGRLLNSSEPTLSM